MQKNIGSQKLIVFAFDSTTNLPKTGDAANITAYESLDWGAVTVLGDTSATEMDATNAKGYYLFDLTQAETNGNTIAFSAKTTTANIVVIGAPAVLQTVTTALTAAQIATGIWQDTTAGDFTTASSVGKSIMNGVALGTGLTVNDITTKTGYSLSVTPPTAAVIASAVWQDTTAADFTTALSVGKSVMNGVALGTGLTVNTVTNQLTAASIAAGVWGLDATTQQTQGTFGQVLGDSTSTAASVWSIVYGGLDANVGSRMATYTQPTGFLAATFPTGTIANTTNITAGTITTTTNLTNAPTVGDFTAAMKTSIGVATDAAITANTLVIEIGADADELITTIGTPAGVSIAADLAEIEAETDGIAAISTAVPLDAAGVRAAVGLASANLDTQIATLATPTNITAGTITNVGTLTTYTGNTPQTADVATLIATIGSPIGVSISADIAEVEADVDLISTATALTAADIRAAVGLASANLDTQIATLATPTNITAGTITNVGTLTTYTGNTPQTADVATLITTVGTPAGATIAADLAEIEGETDGIAAISTAVPLTAADVRTAIGLASANLDAQIATLATPTNITAGTITTVTNLTNAPTVGDLTAAMIASVTSASDAAITGNADIAEINADVDELIATIGVAGAGLTAVSANVTAIDGSTTAATNLASSLDAMTTGAATITTLTPTTMSTTLASAVTDFYKGRTIIWTSGVLAGQAQTITGYDGVTKTLTFTTATAAPGNTDTFFISGGTGSKNVLRVWDGAAWT